ncbi:MAG: type II secretion system protein GspM [Pseudolabrys sp.]|jgi:general secretion pathway protein M
MIAIDSVNRYFTRYPSLSALIYVALIIVLCLTTVYAFADVIEMYRTRNASLEMLSRLNGRNPADNGPWPAGSPVLEGKSATVASAALLQRITNIITRAGGTVVSSEIERQGARSRDGYVTVMATCDLKQIALQKVLYDIEAGMPFLFIKRLDVQAPTPPRGDGRMRVVLAASGLWLGAK